MCGNDVLTSVLLRGGDLPGLADWAFSDQPSALLLARRVEEVPSVLTEAEREGNRGRWVVGFVAYEAAAAFDTALASHAPAGLPPAWFAVFERLVPHPGPGSGGPPPAAISTPRWSAGDHADRVARVRDWIASGDTYQVNLTFPFTGPAFESPESLFARLYSAQPSDLALSIVTPDFAIASVSPELFFTLRDGALTCRPMKGTKRRGRWPAEDAEQAEALRTSAKERAENLMIVDMVRNDLGRIAEVGSVRVDSLFDVSALPSVWQMTSTVTARSRARLVDLFAALFPCASITGAPKVRSMQIIRDLEPGPRGVYCGALGVIGPGPCARFSVAIRTAVVDRRAGALSYGVGSGVVWDSDAGREYAECLDKARVLATDSSPFDLFETLRWEPGTGYARLDLHLERLRRSAAYFGRGFSVADLRVALRDAAIRFPVSARRVRLTLAADGTHRIEHAPVPVVAGGLARFALASTPVDSSDVFLFHKTTRRAVYEAARREHPEADDVLLWNERGDLTESTIANLAVERDGEWLTPPLSAGLLAGCLRDELLRSGALREDTIRVADVGPATRIAVFNSLRGWREGRLSSGG